MMQVEREQQGEQATAQPATRMDSGPLWAAAEALVDDAITQVDALRDELQTLRADLAQHSERRQDAQPDAPHRQAS